MKTSNKLLLSFLGLIVLLMFLSDTVIWANYKRGKAGDGALTDSDHDKSNVIPLSAFKVLKIEGRRDRKLAVVKSDSFQITFWGNKDQQFLYSTKDDTLFVKLRDNDDFTLRCPYLTTVILSGSSIFLEGFQLPALNVAAGDNCTIEVNDMQVNRLQVTGGKESEFAASGDNNKIDSLQLRLGKSSVIKSFDVPYSYVAMDVDSLRELQVTGRSLSGMKQIK
jgi:hypothetical protein